MRYLLQKGKYKYKANLGCYTSLSNGNMTAEQLKDAYKKEGYSVLAFSDFNLLKSHEELSDDTFLPIVAYKTAIENYHFTLYSMSKENLETVEIPSEGNIKQRVNKFISDANDKGFLVCIDHPAKSLQTFHDYEGISGYFALEITDFSSMVEGHLEDNSHVYERVLRKGDEIVYPLACDGNKNEFSFEDSKNDSFGAFAMINAEELSYEAVVNALKNGDFYSSTGPTFEEIYIDGKNVHIKCSPVREIRLMNEGRDTNFVIAPKGEFVTEAVFEIVTDFTGKYVRVDLRDEHGNFANSIPYYIKDLQGEWK